jgi:hypothetical protein
MGKLLAALAVSALGALGLVGLASAGTASSVHIAPGAHTSFNRTWNWQVTKTDSAGGTLTLAQNEVYSLTYTITASNGNPPYTDSGWTVFDGIPISSSTPFTINSLGSVTASATQDAGSVTTAGTVSECATDPVYQSLVTTWPFSGTYLLCAYTVSLPDGTPGTVTANVTFSDGSTGTGSTAFDFSTTTPTVVNGAVNVVDSQGGTLGTLAAPTLHPQTFQYSITVPTGTCGSFDLPNTVNLVDVHTDVSVAHATDTVHVTVLCPHTTGCTLTQGYWKTHSVYGPAAKADPTWNLVGGPDASFFLSGQTWLQVFNTSPSGGNVYYILAHQYEAAKLNILNGASSTSAVDAAIATAESFFGTYTPAQAGALAKTSSARQAALAAATTLDNYNSGLIGPGHCSE